MRLMRPQRKRVKRGPESGRMKRKWELYSGLFVLLKKRLSSRRGNGKPPWLAYWRYGGSACSRRCLTVSNLITEGQVERVARESYKGSQILVGLLEHRLVVGHSSDSHHHKSSLSYQLDKATEGEERS
jgi:hypothetical protein